MTRRVQRGTVVRVGDVNAEDRGPKPKLRLLNARGKVTPFVNSQVEL